MSGNVAKNDDQSAIVQRDPVVKITARIVSGLCAGGKLER
jgi:hypothetical protein